MLVSQKGIAMIEVLPVLTTFVLMVNFALGFFGVIHSGIINSISSRNYAFETFRQRSNLNYLRDNSAAFVTTYYKPVGLRLHAKASEGDTGTSNDATWKATKRPIRFTDLTGTTGDDLPGGQSARNLVDSQVSPNQRVDFEGVSPVWIRVAYGICLTSACGDP
ncbi:MAG: hypothetical protein LW875_03470 [Proteobacteria bacterium]|jgi:hypothetical protein|nr:hypothetical protein [Pseudomonadota bacterium]